MSSPNVIPELLNLNDSKNKNKLDYYYFCLLFQRRNLVLDI